jgi:hypothetical protein
MYLYSEKEIRRGPLAVVLCSGLLAMGFLLRDNKKRS